MADTRKVVTERGGDGGEGASLLIRRILGDERGRGGKLPATGEALDQTQHVEQDRDEDADDAVGRQEAYEHRRAAHDRDDHSEGGPAPYPISQIATEHPAYGTRQERNAVERERRDYGRSAITLGKEERGNNCDRVRVDREVVPLHKVANTPLVPGGEAENPAFVFDVGPANALLDAAVGYLTDGSETYDKDGRRAARGEIHEGLLCSLLEEPYYRLGLPKSTGKELFNLPYLLERLAPFGDLGADDLAATVTALTSSTVASMLWSATTYLRSLLRVGEPPTLR